MLCTYVAMYRVYILDTAHRAITAYGEWLGVMARAVPRRPPGVWSPSSPLSLLQRRSSCGFAVDQW